MASERASTPPAVPSTPQPLTFVERVELIIRKLDVESFQRFMREQDDEARRELD